MPFPKAARGLPSLLAEEASAFFMFTNIITLFSKNLQYVSETNRIGKYISAFFT